MGADIHAVIQVREGGAWRDCELVDDWKYNRSNLGDRHYIFFAALANVRNNAPWEGEPVPFIAEPRGFPDDFPYTEGEGRSGWDTDRQHGDFWMGYHGFSWVTLAEMMAWERAYADAHDPYGFMARWVRYLGRLGSPDDVRVVFGFDS